jgi:hypothetical protein
MCHGDETITLLAYQMRQKYGIGDEIDSWAVSATEFQTLFINHRERIKIVKSIARYVLTMGFPMIPCTLGPV